MPSMLIECDFSEDAFFLFTKMISHRVYPLLIWLLTFNKRLYHHTDLCKMKMHFKFDCWSIRKGMLILDLHKS